MRRDDHEPEEGLYSDRAAGRDRDYRDPDRPIAARGAEGPRCRGQSQLLQQPQAAWPGAAQPRERARLLAQQHSPGRHDAAAPNQLDGPDATVPRTRQFAEALRHDDDVELGDEPADHDAADQD